MFGRASWVLLIAALFSLLPGPDAHAQKLGVVDVQKVIDGIPAWKKAEDAHRKNVEMKKSELEGRQADIKKRVEKLEGKRTVVGNPAAMAAEEEKLRGDVDQFQKDVASSQQDFGEVEEGLKSVVLGRIEKVVAEIAEADDFDMIFERGAETQPNVVFSAASVGLTARVLDGYKKMFGDTPIIAPTRKKSAGGVPENPGRATRSLTSPNKSPAAPVGGTKAPAGKP